ncbi:MAG: TonB-dependent siderophore receptor [Rhizobiales bacterium]|nr:TonB-dependent siderophore receptor [Hyphomicrobiales bacterium]
MRTQEVLACARAWSVNSFSEAHSFSERVKSSVSFRALCTSAIVFSLTASIAISHNPNQAAAQQNTGLDTIVVEGQQPATVNKNNKAPGGIVSEGDTVNRGTSGIDGYIAKSTSTATKTNTPLLDIPQTITVITEDFAEDTGSLTLGQALLYVPGVTVQQGEGHRDQVTIRGQETNADFFTNGVRDDIQYFRDLYNVEAIEVLKGSSALVFGRGGAGGVINRVTKEANFERIFEGTATLGSYDKRYFTADVGNKISENFAIRLNAMYENSEGFRDHYEVERVGFNPTATLKFSKNTKLKASYEYRYDDRTVDRGVPSDSATNEPLRGFQDTFFGNPDASFTEFTGHVATVTFEHKFDGGLQMRSHLSYNDYDKFYQNIMPGSSVDASGNFLIGGSASNDDAGGYNNDTQRESFFWQTDFSYSFNTGDFIKHNMVAGFEYSHQDQINQRFVPTFPGPVSGTAVMNGGNIAGQIININSATNFDTVEFNERTRNRHSEVENTSIFIQDQIEIGQYLEIIGGVRFDRFEIDFEEADDNVKRKRTDEEYSPRIGVVVKPFKGLSLYGSWSRTFLPSSGDQFDNLSSSTVDFEPQEMENSEIGFKWEFMPRLYLTGALYQLDRTNQAVTVGTDRQAGETETKGLELSLSGYLTDDWQVNLGYTNQKSEIQVGDRAGNSVEGVPENQFSLWTRYQFTKMFGAAVGVIHQSDHFATSGNTVTVPGYTRVDAALFADINEKWSAQLNIENLFDKDYFASAHNNNNISPGAPLSAYVTVKAKF